ncbi:MAG TPA: DNA polymerase III subunit beta [Leptospiraceae bacterium]|nr:DNA polymerase III subunit beta [Leptospiraceae bacterium]HMY65077.1 DNA polymerase III subunit beta [Leptospiraceae bacterium]HNF12649.1 DNA polymerase III subunit beta [Leptospiraceae bacterium]HNF23442.1 DNA polymerase III subunit beta [Leptospiraceae bacterium]HNI95079.1 DNA polymerase III subunit beta [Leptospiraceae bacterium]
MKFSVKTSEIMKAIHNVEGIISSRDIKSLLSNIKIECAGDRISLSATDLEISIRSRVNATIEKEGTYCIPAKQLSNVIKVVNFTETRLETVQEEDTFQTFVTDAENKVDFKMSINGYEGEELKTITETSDRDLVDFPCFTLSSMLKKTFYSVAVEDTRYVFNGIYLKSTDNKITAVGTDGRRLAKLEREVPNKLPFTKGVIVPHKAIREILKLIESASDGKIGLIENQIYVSVNENALQCKLIDGAYPDYESVIPKESKYKVKLSKDAVQTALRQALIAAEEPIKQIRLTFETNLLRVNSSNPGSTEFSVSIPVAYDGEHLTMAFKGDYLNDVIKSVDDQEILMEFSSSGAPAVFRDPSDVNYTAVIMPMKL